MTISHGAHMVGLPASVMLAAPHSAAPQAPTSLCKDVLLSTVATAGKLRKAACAVLAPVCRELQRPCSSHVAEAAATAGPGLSTEATRCCSALHSLCRGRGSRACWQQLSGGRPAVVAGGIPQLVAHHTGCPAGSGHCATAEHPPNSAQAVARAQHQPALAGRRADVHGAQHVACAGARASVILRTPFSRIELLRIQVA